ncbi:MAG: aspartate ammonia-lyase [Nitrososphaerota archaeon]
MERYRVEEDSLGEVRVPQEAYWGAQTQRALENFPISGLRLPQRFIWAVALIKLAAARANARLGLLKPELARAIELAAREVLEGKWSDQFPVDVFQTGSGTSTNMNVNEVLANRANELLGGAKGAKRPVHPNDHVNLCQSSNDVIPSAIHISCYEAISQELLPSLEALGAALRQKAQQYGEAVKAGRTHLQDAVPVTFGQELQAWASMVERGLARIREAMKWLLELPLGGTAVGTGLNAHPEFATLAVNEIRAMTGHEYFASSNPFEGLQSRAACVYVSGALTSYACDLMKIANDLRLLYSGPNTGLAEIELPAVQPGSSIMPGKVNPVIPEAVAMACAQVIGYNATIALAAQQGQLELNTMMPVIAYDLLQAIALLANASRVLATKCLEGLRANVERMRRYAESSLALVTALAPKLGYDAAAQIAKLAVQTGKPIKELVVERGLLSEEEASRLLDVKRLARGSKA